MKVQDIIQALEKTGHFLRQWTLDRRSGKYSNDMSSQFSELISQQHELNNWHSGDDLTAMLDHLGQLLSFEKLNEWVGRYPRLANLDAPSSPVLVKPNINFAFAGIQEWLGCLITQSPFVLTAAENQFQVLKFLAATVSEANQNFAELMDIQPKNSLKPQHYIIHAEKRNDSIVRYFSTKKSIIIEPRSTVGVITGRETDEELKNLGNDIFIHLGQSPRTLRKLYLPEHYDIRRIIIALEPFAAVYRNNKYANNYDYHQSVFLMNKIPFLDNGFLIFREDASDEAPTGCLYYEYYTGMELLMQKIGRSPLIENIICSDELPVKTIRPGTSHFFSLGDFFNGKDLVQFLLE